MEPEFTVCLRSMAHIYYGSFRFWFFSITIPESILKLMEEDAYHLIWASNPVLFSNEEGTLTQSRAYIIRRASYLAQKKGGAGLMHLRSHIRAFCAQWGRRYLDPSNPPWKSVADLWIANNYSIGRGALLANITGNLYEDIPPTAEYFRMCIKEFEKLELKQDLSILDHHVAGEPLDFNHRFDIRWGHNGRPVDGDIMAKWQRHICLIRVDNMCSQDTHQIFTDNEMEDFTYELAPPNIKNTPRAHEWSDELMETWPAIKSSVPQAVIAAASIQYVPSNLDYVTFTPDDNRGEKRHFYAKAEEDKHTGTFKYQKQWVDRFGTPHDTGVYVRAYEQLTHIMRHTALWIVVKDEDEHHTGFQNVQQSDPLENEEEPDIGKKLKSQPGKKCLHKIFSAI